MFLSLATTVVPLNADDAEVDYVRDVQPIFEAHCFDCHGEETSESGLRLDRRSSLLRGGDSGEPAVLPGKATDSHLVQLITGKDSSEIMPPDGERLQEREVTVITAWINAGAKMPKELAGSEKLSTDHWSFQRLSTPQIPTVDVSPFVNNPIDSFVAAKLKEQQLVNSPRANSRALVRRLFLVMHGLPPTPEQMQTWAARLDSSSHNDRNAAWLKLVDEGLQNPRYGERWAQHWLDIIRFGETHGFETNRERPNAWHFRDYVIAAFNSDLPYDQFVKEQIAGDAFGQPVATGFLVAGPHDIVKSPDVNLTLMQRQDELSDLINVTGTTFLGLTVGCARCHNHKFDPISQRDFYALQAVFAGVNHADRILPLSPQAEQRIAEIDNQTTRLKEALTEFLPKSAGDSDGSDAKRVRPPVNAKHNVEEFPSTNAKFVRFTIRRTNSSQPCIDELEVWSGDRNVALAANGTVPSSSGDLPGYEIHKLKHINDGRHGNSFSWISNQPGKGWVQLEFSRSEQIDRIEWGRDRDGKYGDRVAIDYVIESSLDGDSWKTLSSSADRKPFEPTKQKDPTYDFSAASPERAAEGKAWLKQIEDLAAERKSLTDSALVYAGTFTEPPPTHRLYRGDPLTPREEVSPDTLEVIATLGLASDTPEQQRRVEFANWVADRNNPLTARVIVNRIWQHHFGTGIVATPNDFGANGTPPSHPQLLDWLANEFMENEWSLKHLHRLILTSGTWQQDSRPDGAALGKDAATRFLWRFPPRRLEAEAIRDSILAVTGALNPQMGGPGFSGFEVEMENVRHFFPKTTYEASDFRRMIYMTKVRQERESVFGAFDCPDASQVISKRSRSTTPLQALNLMNSVFTMQQSELFAKRLQDEADSRSEQVQLAYQLCFGRQASHSELSDAIEFLKRHGMPAFCRAILNSNEFLFLP